MLFPGVDKISAHGLVHVIAYAAYGDMTPAKAVTRDDGRHGQHIATDASVPGRCGQKARIAGYGPQIANMVGESFQLKRQAAQMPGAF